MNSTRRLEWKQCTKLTGLLKDVGILFWIRKDMYVKNSRKKVILNHMIKFFTDTEEYRKCAYLHKGVLILEETQIEAEINNQLNNIKIN